MKSRRTTGAESSESDIERPPVHLSSRKASETEAATQADQVAAGAQNKSRLAASEETIKLSADKRANQRRANENRAAGGQADVVGRERPTRAADSQSGPPPDERDERDKGQRARHKKSGLLEVLLGERGRNWLEQKTLILDIQNGKKQGQRKVSDCENRVAKETDAKDALAGSQQHHQDEPIGLSDPQQDRYRRLPTFGSIPQKLKAPPERDSQDRSSREVPHFAYHGRARNVEIRGPHQTGETRRAQTQQTSRYRSGAGELHRSSLTNSRLSNLSGSSTAGTSESSGRRTLASTSSGASPRPTPSSESRPPHATAGSKASFLGFSNISNLFPGEPVDRRQRDRAKSASLINLSDKQAYARQRQQLDKLLLPGPRGATAASWRETQTARQRHRSLNRPAPAGTMMRQRSSGIGIGSSQQLSAGSQANAKANYQQRLRPASATGNYLNSAGRQRSPAGSHRLGSAGMSPLVDPDCPVHGDYPPGPVPGGQRGRSYERDRYEPKPNERGRYGAYQTARPEGAGYYSSSQPDLLFGANGVPVDQDDLLHEDPYNLTRPARDYPAYGGARPVAGYQRSSPIYSPLSPADYEGSPYAHRQQHQQQRAGARAGERFERRGPPTDSQAYYNSSSRFSLYHSAADGSGGVRSSLAPTGEQLRRILGYRPLQPAKPVHLHPQWAYTRPFIHLQPAGSGFGRTPSPAAGEPDPLDAAAPDVPKFAPFNRLQDSQAIRAVDFHPGGEVYAVGSNSRALRICAYPAEHELRHFDPFEGVEVALEAREPAGHNEQQPVRAPRVLFKFLQLHRGSIYCVSFNPSGQLLATGSNDQTVHIVKYNSITHNPDGEEFRLTMHSGTIRDLCFIDDSSGNGSSLLLSAGGGDNKIYVTDCDTITPFQSMAGHTNMVMALNHCGGAQFVSGSYDRTIRFWDLRSRSCTSIVSAPPTAPSGAASGAGAGAAASGPGAPVCALRVDPSGRLLVSGHTDTTCMLYDIRGGKIIQTFRPHDDEIRAISFSPKSYYLLTGGYDGRLVVSDLQGDLTQPLPSACVAESQDKIVQAKWHPADFTFVTTSADKSATLWSLPGEIRN